MASSASLTTDAAEFGEADQQRAAYTLALQQFDAMIEWNKDGVDAALRKTAAALEIKLKDMIRAFYLAVLGSPQGVPLFDAITHLGRDILRERLRHAMELLGRLYLDGRGVPKDDLEGCLQR